MLLRLCSHEAWRAFCVWLNTGESEVTALSELRTIRVKSREIRVCNRYIGNCYLTSKASDKVWVHHFIVSEKEKKKKEKKVWVHHFIVSNLPEDDLFFET